MVVMVTGDIMDSSSNHVSDCHGNSDQNVYVYHQKECKKSGNGNHGEI